jgi:hypothetical protein
MEKKFVYVPRSERKRPIEDAPPKETNRSGNSLASTLRYLASNPQTTRKPFKLCYSSDLHGNLDHYKMLVQSAEENKCDFIFFGGDLHPKRKGPITKFANLSNNLSFL